MPDVHLKFSPSGSARWLACPASLHGPEREDKTSDAAAEGTAAHKLCQRCLLLGCEPEDFRDDVVDGYVVTDEMISGAKMFLDAAEVHASEFDFAPYETHSEIFLQSREFPEFGGTVDLLLKSNAQIVVIDFKFGMRSVEVENNSQLLCYAMLARDNEQAVRVVVVQPRASHDDGPVRSWDVPEETILDFGDRVAGTIRGNKGANAEKFVSGEHCRYCPRKIDCPELYRLSIKAAETEFTDPDRAANPNDVDNPVNVALVAEILSAKKAIAIHLKAVEDYAKTALERGEAIPGFKLVAAFGNRRYCVDEAIVLRKCRALKTGKFGKKQIYKTEILSPAALEKVVGKELVNSLVERPLKGTTVVPETDKRSAVDRQTLAEVFKDVD